jgi:N-acetylglucosamine kinase-like BadF-type ATPase
MSTLLLGVDGGATKTLALIADGDGRVRGAGRAGSSDIHAEADPLVAVARVMEAVRAAADASGVRPSELDSCTFSLCGADWPEDVELYQRAFVEELGLPGAPEVVNDAFGALRAGTTDGVGMALVIGTGAAIAARGPRGDTWFSGERMEASGALEFGRRGYESLIGSEYGLGDTPVFTADALAAFDVATIEELIHAVSRTGGLGRRSLARLTPILLQAAEDGDQQAATMVADQAHLLTSYVRRSADGVGLPADATVVLSGGVFRHHSTKLPDAIRAGLGGFVVEQSSVEPVFGAILAAADRCGVQPDTTRLTETGPEEAFFHTL